MRSLEDYDSRGYRFFCSKRDIDKALNTLYGLIEGIAIDRAINPREIAEIDHWLSFHQTLLKKAPFSEIATYLKVALYDGILTQEEKFDILWACEQLSPNNPYAAILL